MQITRRHFEARYNQMGRCMLAALAETYGVDPDTAEHWADEIDRETEKQIAAVQTPLLGNGIAGSGAAGLGVAPAPPIQGEPR